ncbi:DUF4142 domain-containing protein [Rufibacter psychrotolerans]|uniref:DUF4142 domain-containing protein n=1 Tax=Rufibacter psychrotolerans TaxID=2812556 RepID=UPI001968634F|nr:DUF4142 domain-containing protein [Rufibacter sp. SYSU D00308]
MHKTMKSLLAVALLATAACTSTDTSTDTAAATTTAETTTIADVAAGQNPTGPGGREATGDQILDMQDPMFLIDAGSSNLLEIQLGQLAAQKATNPEVKQFGQMMADHHANATNELKQVAAQLNVTLPTTLTQEHQALVEKLTGLTGPEFDVAYMDAMETAHRLDIAKFELKSQNAENNRVKEFAAKHLPILRSHFEMATRLEDKVD